MSDPKNGSMSSILYPKICYDPRFRAGRALVKIGKASEGAINMFASLLEETRIKYGETSLEAAACYYEYGHSLFCGLSACDAEKNDSSTTKLLKADNDDLALALEMMETAFAVIDQHCEEQNGTGSIESWVDEQRPRILVGIGDVLSFQNKHADAVDAYIRAVPFRQEAVERATNKITLDYLKRRRLLTETFILVTEALLACPLGVDVIASSSPTILVKGEEKLDYVRGYYEKARDELQETVLLMGTVAAAGLDFQSEKEDVCFLATMLMGIGNTLSDIDYDENMKSIAVAH